MKKILFLFLLGFSLPSFSQTTRVYGVVSDALSNKPIPFANVVVEGTVMGAVSDADGRFEISNIEPGEYNFKASFIGYDSQIKSEIYVRSNKSLRLDFLLSENALLIEEVQVKANTFNKTEASPTSLRTISATEIYRSPGGNRDVSKVIANLPGVSTTPSFRNDIIIRGGAPSENRFFLDGVEIPNINHFATQGSSGGPVGILNVNFIREVDFYSGAFPANRGNALSSVMDLKQIEGSEEEFSLLLEQGTSDVGLMINTPLSDKSALLFSARRSYLQLLFKVLGLPFLPTYNDMQFKYTLKPDKKNQFNLIGLAAIDDFSLNSEVNKGVSNVEDLARNNYILNNLAINEQWNYTVGGTWRRFIKNSNLFIVLSRSHLNNTAEKYLDYKDMNSLKLLDYQSEEIENKSRLEYNFRKWGLKFNTGLSIEDATYTNATNFITTVRDSVFTQRVSSDLYFIKYAGFAQISKRFFNEKLISSFGLRYDANSFTESKTTPNLSPRVSMAYNLSEKQSVNASVARYYQLPSYTILGFKPVGQDYLNKDAEYIQCEHAILGVEYNPSNYSKITIESFYKSYANYPFSNLDSISLANVGGDFGVVGNEDISSVSKGRTYGLELLAQQKLTSSLYGILALTYYFSDFEDKNKELIPTAWDNRFIVNLNAGKKFKRNLEVGAKFRFSGGAPYTPIDLATSSQYDIWDANQGAVLDYERLNQERLASKHTLDIRVDKKWFYKNCSLNFYIDIENVYNSKIELPFAVDVNEDSGELVYEAQDNKQQNLYKINNESGTVLPKAGFVLEF